MDETEVVWDEDNLYHLLVTNADRGISPEDVETVIKDRTTAVDPLGNGHDLYTGSIGDRYLQVIAMGEREVYPKTAWWCDQARWRRAHE
ncbi:MAG TPA: hypothetical protein VH134_00345 [Candidatus Dormibacteraeota bacterium]|nr:hypothetical protein [Candidatus Dormibacteraeota bacterium]